MLYPKSAEQATFEWMQPLPFYSLGYDPYVAIISTSRCQKIVPESSKRS